MPRERKGRETGLHGHDGTPGIERQAELSHEDAGLAPPDALDARIEEAVRLHAKLVYRIAYSVLRNAADAEDATQEVFVRVLRFREKVSEVRDMRTWLARIAWRVALDRRPRLAAVPLEDEADAEVRTLASRGASAEEIAVGNGMRRLLDRLVEGLPKELREVLRLSAVAGLDSREVGEILGVPDATVRTRLLRARRLLKDGLARAMEGAANG